jgi:hypothetical protein
MIDIKRTATPQPAQHWWEGSCRKCGDLFTTPTDLSGRPMRLLCNACSGGMQPWYRRQPAPPRDPAK